MRAAGSVASTGLGFISCSDLRETNRNQGTFQYVSVPPGSASCASPHLSALHHHHGYSMKTLLAVK